MDQMNIQAISQIVLRTKPSATAALIPGALAPHVLGSVHFYPAADGTLVVAEVFGLPRCGIQDKTAQKTRQHSASGAVVGHAFGRELL